MHSHNLPLFKKKYYAIPIMRRKPKKSEIKFVLNLYDFTIKNDFLHINLNPLYQKELLWGKKPTLHI